MPPGSWGFSDLARETRGNVDFRAGFYSKVVGVKATGTSALNAMIYSFTRISFALGRDGYLPKYCARISRRNRTPAVAAGLIAGAPVHRFRRWSAVFLPCSILYCPK